jgi:hypothetical protein
MSSSGTEIQTAIARHVEVSNDALSVNLADGRTLSVPLAWYPRFWIDPEEAHPDQFSVDRLDDT